MSPHRGIVFSVLLLLVSLLPPSLSLTLHSNIIALRGPTGLSLSLFLRTTENTLATCNAMGGRDTVAFTPWKGVGGARELTSHPAAAATAEGRAIVFARGGDNLLHGAMELESSNPLPTTAQASRWGPWLQLASTDSPMASMPVAGTLGDGRVLVLAVNDASRVMFTVQENIAGLAFSDWKEIGHLPVPVRGLPQIVRTPDGEVSVYAIGSDLRIYRAEVTSKYVWSEWVVFDEVQNAPHSGFLSLRGVTTIGGRVLLFVFDATNRLLHTTQRVRDSHYWTGWTPFTPIDHAAHIISVAVERNDPTELITVLGKTSKNTLMLRRQDRETGWTAWRSIGGRVKRDPFLVSDGHLGEHVFAVGLDGVVVHKFLKGDSELDWAPLPGVRAD